MSGVCRVNTNANINIPDPRLLEMSGTKQERFEVTTLSHFTEDEK